MITAKTFTAQYDAVEDRIRLILNYADASQRIDLMITRAMFLKLVPALEQLLPNGAEAIRSSKGEEPSKPGFESTDHATLELTRHYRELLVQKVDFTLHKKEKNISLLFYGDTPEAPAARTTLSRDGLEQVTGILLGAIPFIEWGIAPNILKH